MEHFNIKRVKIENTFKFNFSADLEIVKNEDLIHNLCTHEVIIKDELEANQYEKIDETSNYTSGEIGKDGFTYAYNCENKHEGIQDAVDSNLQEKNSSMQTSTLLDSYNSAIKYSSSRQCLDLFKEDITKCNSSNPAESVMHQSIQKLELPTTYMYSNIKKFFECNNCNYKSAYKSNLVDHVKIHTTEKPLECTVCDLSCASSKSSLNEHTKIHTHEENLLKCNVCNLKFTHKSYLFRHIRTHTGEKTYTCTKCNFTCTRHSYLMCHMRIHAREKT